MEECSKYLINKYLFSVISLTFVAPPITECISHACTSHCLGEMILVCEMYPLCIVWLAAVCNSPDLSLCS